MLCAACSALTLGSGKWRCTIFLGWVCESTPVVLAKLTKLKPGLSLVNLGEDHWSGSACSLGDLRGPERAIWRAVVPCGSRKWLGVSGPQSTTAVRYLPSTSTVRVDRNRAQLGGGYALSFTSERSDLLAHARDGVAVAVLAGGQTKLIV